VNLILFIHNANNLKAELEQYRELHSAEILEALYIEYTYDSNRIEGNTLTLRETDLVIHKDLTIGGKPMNEHLEAINHYEAIRFIHDLVTSSEPFNKRNLLAIHTLILHGLDRDNAGCFRQVPVMISGSQHTPPQPWQVDKLMEDYR
jgi:Fic family protein